MASRPAIGRPAGVVRSSASVSETKPTPRWLQFPAGWPVGPLLTGRDPGTRPTPRLFPDGGGLDHVLAGLSPRRSGVDLADLPSNRPAAPGNVLPPRPVLHCEGLLINCGDAGVQAGPEHFRRPACLAKNGFPAFAGKLIPEEHGSRLEVASHRMEVLTRPVRVGSGWGRGVSGGSSATRTKLRLIPRPRRPRNWPETAIWAA